MGVRGSRADEGAGAAQRRFVKRAPADVWTGGRPRGSGDDELVEDARGGDREAFALLYQRHKHEVWQLAWFTLRDHHEAEDAVQETFLKAHRALHQHRPGTSLRAWLLAICRNGCRDRLRARGRRPVVPLDDAVVAAPPGAESAVAFRAALDALPVEEREAFLLVDVLGCSSDEAANVLGLRAASTLRSRLSRARRALAPALDPGDGAPAGTGAPQVWGLLHGRGQSALVVAFAGDVPGGD
ncbi:MAG: RNA polymerase sigma factor, partial [Solirubrobacterales bacterium]|nr:RNA polymerase sigma factor [Solirubrobacterales bacterium]